MFEICLSVLKQPWSKRAHRIMSWSSASSSSVTDVMLAASVGDVQDLARLLDRDPGLVHAREPGLLQQTALMRAASRNRVDVVRLLLARGSDVDATDRLGRSALFIASSHGLDESVRVLLDVGGAAVPVGDADGWNALHVAAFHGQLVAVRALLSRPDARAAVDARNRHGQTPLWLACYAGHAQVALSLLVEGGADRSLASGPHDLTPRRAAEHRGQAKCVAVMEWFEREVGRACILHKARCCHAAAAAATSLPACLRARVAAGRPLPTLATAGDDDDDDVEVCGQEEGVGGSAAGRGSGGQEDDGGERAVGVEEEGERAAAAAEEEEREAVVGLVAGEMVDELYHELLEGLRLG